MLKKIIANFIEQRYLSLSQVVTNTSIISNKATSVKCLHQKHFANSFLFKICLILEIYIQIVRNYPD